MAKFHNKGCFVMTEDRVIDEYERLFVFNRAADLRAARCRFVQDVCNDAQRAWSVSYTHLTLPTIYSV